MVFNANSLCVPSNGIMLSMCANYGSPVCCWCSFVLPKNVQNSNLVRSHQCSSLLYNLLHSSVSCLFYQSSNNPVLSTFLPDLIYWINFCLCLYVASNAVAHIVFVLVFFLVFANLPQKKTKKPSICVLCICPFL